MVAHRKMMMLMMMEKKRQNAKEKVEIVERLN